jgi:patatin-related protein
MTIDYSAEVRFSIVMYGGVSLAIYINGVANELYELACATPKDGGPGPDGGSGTRDVYRRLSTLVNNAELIEVYRKQLARNQPSTQPDRPTVSSSANAGTQASSQRTRFVVDVVSGTSAGGINGIFLAKALANGEPFSPLKKMWIDEADIALLLNDKSSYKNLCADRSAKPESLLNSDRMYLKLLNALNATSKEHAPDESPLVDELDLFVTTTDICGTAVPLRLFDKVVKERRYKAVYRFRYDGKLRNDFVPANNEFFAFAARCTSSFPVAFEPMTLSAVTRLRPDKTAHATDIRSWDRFFPEELADGKHLERAFGDGGYLDNKPFGYAIRALSYRQGTLPLERKLIYVEPSPEHFEPGVMAATERSPNAIANALAAVTQIPRYETIREDLQDVLHRNRRIERVERIVRLGEVDLEKQDPFAGLHISADGSIPDWGTLRLSELLRFYGNAFLAYRRLRVITVTDELADQLAYYWKVEQKADLKTGEPSSDLVYGLRALVRAWRERQFDEEAADNKETINSFLYRFDLSYRFRRVGFLLRKIDQLTRLVSKQLRGLEMRDLSESDRLIAERLRREGLDLNAAKSDDSALSRMLAALSHLKAGMQPVHATLRRATQEPLLGHNKTPPPELRAELRLALALLLGQRTAAEGPLKLSMEHGASIPVSLPDQFIKTATATRTLQETVFNRAQWLFGAAVHKPNTRLQSELEHSIKALEGALHTIIRGPSDGPETPDFSAARAWQLLGSPKWAVAQSGPPNIEVRVTNTGEEVLDAPEAVILREIIGEYYLRFDSFDQMSFPLYYDTNTGEPATVEVVRISPEDAPSLINESSRTERRRKLAGTALAHFGAFLDERFRRNDIMWGRLDGAERLISALLPAPDEGTATVRAALIREAHGVILREELTPLGYAQLTNLFCEALASANGTSDSERVHYLVDALAPNEPAKNGRITDILTSLMTEAGLLAYVRDARDVNRTLDPGASMNSTARAVTIAGRVLERIVERDGQRSAGLRWIARVGLAAQAMLAVSLPGSFTSLWWSHLLKVLYAFEVFVVLIAVLAGAQETRGVALTALGVTATLHLVTLVAGDKMRQRQGWLKLVAWVLALGLLGLAAFGAYSLMRLGGLLG